MMQVEQICFIFMAQLKHVLQKNVCTVQNLLPVVTGNCRFKMNAFISFVFKIQYLRKNFCKQKFLVCA